MSKRKSKIDVVTLFPGMFEGPFGESIIKRARDRGIVEINVIDLRNYSHDKHRKVDDYPYGGGAGMVMKPEPFFEAVEHLSRGSEEQHVILLSPQGKVFHQEKALQLSFKSHLIFLCGHYEGVDERVRKALADEDISLGDFVLTGGEIPAMAMIDSIVRLLPGVVSEKSTAEESFVAGRLEYPQYTRPSTYKGMDVPQVLLSGNHQEIFCWRKKESFARTLENRPDLINDRDLDINEKE